MKALKNIKKNGYHVFKSVFSKQFIEKLNNTLKKYEVSTQAGFFNNKASDQKTVLVLNLHSKNKIFLELLNNKLITKINSYFLNDKYYKSLNKNLPNYILHQFVARSSGKSANVLHVDDKAPSISNKVNFLQWAIPLTDVNEENGCTQLIPGTHRSGIFKPPSDKKIKKKDVLLNVGDMAVWDGRLWHGARDNKTKKDRWVIIITFSRWFFKPYFDIPRNLPKKFYKYLNNNLKIILGFASIPKYNEKSGLVQRGSLKSANIFLKKGLF